MIAADIAKLLCAWPPGGSPCAKLRQSIVILAGLIVAKANECVRRAAVMWISQKMPESDGCFGETILVITGCRDTTIHPPKRDAGAWLLDRAGSHRVRDFHCGRLRPDGQ